MKQEIIYAMEKSNYFFLKRMYFDLMIHFKKNNREDLTERLLNDWNEVKQDYKDYDFYN
jgi:hypothetical protein